MASEESEVTEETGKALGRPTDYRPDFCEIVAELAQDGATDFEICQALDCSTASLYRWSAKYPAFRAALKLGHEAAADRVERSLYHRANGYSFNAVKIMQSAGQPVVVPYVEHVPPSENAAIFWLTNRRSKDWKNQKTLEVKGNQDDGGLVDAIIERFKKLKEQAVEGEIVQQIEGPK